MSLFLALNICNIINITRLELWLLIYSKNNFWTKFRQMIKPTTSWTSCKGSFLFIYIGIYLNPVNMQIEHCFILKLKSSCASHIIIDKLYVYEFIYWSNAQVCQFFKSMCVRFKGTNIGLNWVDRQTNILATFSNIIFSKPM